MAEVVSMRKAYGNALVALGRANPDVVALSADVSNSDFSYMFEEAFPERFFNVGIAEQSLVDVAVGLAYSGKIPFANTFAFLFATRALEMVRTHLCYGEANVKLMAAYAGLSDSFDGPTHHAITDVAGQHGLRQRRQAAGGPRHVGRRGDVAPRVDQRAVEVEDERPGGAAGAVGMIHGAPPLMAGYRPAGARASGPAALVVDPGPGRD